MCKVGFFIPLYMYWKILEPGQKMEKAKTIFVVGIIAVATVLGMVNFII